MFGKSSTGSTRRIRSVHVVAAGAIVLAMSGSATAAMVITGKQIKDNSITSRDIKNGTLKVKDLRASEAAKLRGNTGATGATGATGGTGATGATGAAGASAFAPPPSGTVISGGGILNVEVSGSSTQIRSYAPVPFTAATPFRELPPRNIWYGSTAHDASVSPGDLNAAACPGTATAPVPTAGQLCVYPTEVENSNALRLFAGVTSFNTDGADRSGFFVTGTSTAPGIMRVRYVWAYKAP